MASTRPNPRLSTISQCSLLLMVALAALAALGAPAHAEDGALPSPVTKADEKAEDEKSEG